MKRKTLKAILAKFVAPSNYTPFTECDELSWFLDGIKLLDKELGTELYDWLYHWYALPSVWEIEWQEFNISGYEDFKKYLMWMFCKS